MLNASGENLSLSQLKLWEGCYLHRVGEAYLVTCHLHYIRFSMGLFLANGNVFAHVQMHGDRNFTIISLSTKDS